MTGYEPGTHTGAGRSAADSDDTETQRHEVDAVDPGRESGQSAAHVSGGPTTNGSSRASDDRSVNDQSVDERADGRSAGDDPPGNAGAGRQYRYVEEYVRHKLSETLGGARGMLEGAIPFVVFTAVWMISEQLYPSLGTALGSAVILAVIRLVQRQSLRYVVQAVVPTGIAAIVASKTGRAEDAFLPGILYNGGLAVVSVFTIAIRKPLVGFILGAAMADPLGWTRDRGLVKMMSKLTAVLAVPYVLRFVIQLPIYWADHIVALGVAKVVLGWPLLVLALAVIGMMLSRGRTPIAESGLADGSDATADRVQPGRAG